MSEAGKDMQRRDAAIEAIAERRLSRIVMADGTDIVGAGLIYAVVCTGGVVRVLIDDERFDPEQVFASELPDLIQKELAGLDGVVRVVVKPRPRSIRVADPIPGIRHVIGVHSVKGGVGKSTVTAHLALAFARQGLRVGLLDADVYGPSVPLLFAAHEEAKVDESTNRLRPVERNGIRLMSLGFMLDADEPLIWRGNLIDEGIPQMFSDVDWGELDVLLIDMPPGTGDVPIALARHAPLDGVIVVTAPSQLSLADVRRGLEFFADVQVPILGLVENMAAYSCECGELIPLFGRGAGSRLAEELGLELLASLPFEEGVVAAGESEAGIAGGHAPAFTGAVEQVARRLRLRLMPGAGSDAAEEVVH